MADLSMPATDQSRLVVVREWSGQYRIANDLYEPIARELVEHYKELVNAHPKSILFVENTTGKAKVKGKKVYARISAMPAKITDIIYQMSGRYFSYLLELQKENMLELSWEQVVMAIYRELRKIDAEGKISGYNIEEFSEVLYHLGPDWDAKNRVIPNLMEAKGEWARMKQPRLFEPDEFLESEDRVN